MGIYDGPDTGQVLPNGKLIYEMEDGRCLAGNVYSAEIEWYMDPQPNRLETFKQQFVFTAKMDNVTLIQKKKESK